MISKFSHRAPRYIGVKFTLLACTLGCASSQAQVQNISAWTLDTSDSTNTTVGGITYQNNYATPLTVTTAVGVYNAGTAGAGADDVFVRRNTATPTGTENVAGQAVSILSASSGSATVYGTYNPTMQDLLLGGNVLNSTWDTFANTSSGAGGVGHNIERIDFVWSNGYTIIGDEVIIVFNFDPIGAQDDFRVAVFTEIDNSVDKLPTSYANTGVLVTGTNYPDKLPLPLSGSPLSSPSTGFRTTATDNLSGTALSRGDSQTVGIGGVAISLATLGISPGQTIFGYSLIPSDANASTAANLLDFTNNSLYPTNTANADATGTADFSTFGGRIATIVSTTGSAAFEWDGQNGNNKWGATNGGETNTNWYSPVPAESDRTPFRDSDVIFGALPSTNQTVDLDNNVEVRKMTFDSDINYTIGVSGDTPTITFGDPNLAGLPSIEVTALNGDYGQHKINANINLLEALAINNNSFSTLCINGFIETRSNLAITGNTITVTGQGAVNFNGDISGSGDLVKTGVGITTINNNNSDDPSGTPTQWIGNVAIDEGQLVITADGALGGSVNRTNILTRASGDTTIRLTNANAADLKIGQLVSGTNIPAGTYITGLSVSGGNTTITLSNALTGAVTNTASITFAGATTVASGATLTLRPNAAGTPLSYTVAETITLHGNGISHGQGPLGALYNDGGDNTLGANVSLRLGSDAAIGSRAGNLTLNGVVSEASAGRSLVKVGEGVVTLANSANSYTGATVVAGGALRVTAETALPGGFATGGASGGNLTLAGGVLEIGLATNFIRALGAGNDQVQFTGDGGFSAHDATTPGLTRTVTLGTAPVWGSGSFVPTGNALLLSSAYSNGTVDFTNTINLGGSLREVRVANGSAAVDGRLSGVLSGTGGLDKTGAGTLELTANNTYTGETRVSGGALRVGDANRINGSDLVLNGGVLEINADLDTANTGDFTRSVGTTGADDVRWTGDGGFSASTANREVRLNNGVAAITWGGATPTSGFVGADNALILGSVGSGNTVTLANPLVLDGTGDRTIRTVAGTTAGIANGTLTGALSGSAGFAVTGNGRLDLTTAVNTNTGVVTITGGEVRLSGASTMASVVDSGGTSGFTIQQGGRLVLDYSGSAAIDRINNATDITLAGGRLDMFGRNANDFTETLGVLRSTLGENQINVQRTSTNDTVLAFDSLDRTAGSTLEFTNDTSGGTLGDTGNNPRVTFATSPGLESTILPYAVYGDGTTPTAFAGITSGRLTGVTGTGTDEASWTASIIAAPAGGNDTLLNTSNRTVGALNLGSGINVTESGGARTLIVETGALLSTGGTVSNISVSNLQVGGTGAQELIAHVYGTGGLNISSRIQNNGNTTGLVKSGSGTLTLSGTTANTHTGVTTVNDGTLVLAKSDGVNAIAGDGNTATTDLAIGDGRGVDTVRLGASEQIADNAQVILRGGELGNTANIARLELNGATTITDSSRVETFHTLSVTGNSVLDFGGGTVCSPTYLYLDVLSIAASDALLTITNWLEFTDFLLVDKDTFDESQLARIVFDGYPGTARWQHYDSDYYQITPVPEPATYGLLALGGLTAFATLRRRRIRTASAPSL